MSGTYFNNRKIPLNTTESIPRFKTRLYGDWDKTIRTLNQLSPEIKKCSIKAQLRVGNIIKDKVRAHIANQDLNWSPLSLDYQRAKAKKGLDSRTLVSWGEYYHAINVWQVGTQHLVMIGVKSGLKTRGLNGKKSKLEIAQIALIHEFSKSKKIPRRPLWNPTIAELGGTVGIKNLFVKHFYATLRRNGIPFKLFKL